MTRFLRPNITRMAGYVPGEQPRDGGFIKLNTNENPYPPSPRVKAAIVDAVAAPEPPLRLLLGKVAVAAARGKIEALKRDFETWAAVSEAADFPTS